MLLESANMMNYPTGDPYEVLQTDSILPFRLYILVEKVILRVDVKIKNKQWEI